ncbi:DUF2142 domain-containing protein [bacterium]|nr:DUF2142 domain-containing protein [bacterium]
MSRGIVVIAAFALCALSYSLWIPPGEAPDEPAHLKYAGYLAETGQLPGAEFIESDSIPEAFQPPLYHGAVAGLIRAGVASGRIVWVKNPEFERSAVDAEKNEYDARSTSEASGTSAMQGFYFARLFSVVLGIILVVLCLKLVGANGLLPLTILLVTPAFVFASGTLGNDVMAGVWTAAALLAYQKWRETNALTPLLLCSLFFGLGLLTKLSVLFLWAPLLLFEFIRTKKSGKMFSSVALFAIPLAISIAVIARSLELHPHRAHPDRLEWIQSGAIPWLFSWVSTFVKTIYHSLFTSVGVLGAQAVWLPGWVYGLFFLMGLLFAGVMFRSLPKRFAQLVNVHTAFLSAVIAVFGLFFASVYWFRESGECMHARLFIPFVPGLLLGFTNADFARLPVLRGWKTALWSSLIVSAVIALLPHEALVGAAMRIAEVLHGTSDPQHYAEVLSRVAQIVAICSLGFIVLRTEVVVNKLESVLTRKLVWISVLGLIFNLLLLFLYVRPILSQ